MSTPTRTESAGELAIDWKEEKIHVRVSRARSHKDGRITGELLITTTRQDCPPHLHQAQFNFSSTQARTSLAKTMQQKYEADWEAILEQLAVYVLGWMRQGEPVQEICTAQEFAAPEYLLYPVVLKDEPTVLFGEGESVKSLTALLFSILMQLPYPGNELGLTTLKTVTRVLYLDWETSFNEVGWRLKCLQRGLELPDLTLNYRRCALPLADDLDSIQQMIQEKKADCIIVDSIGAAAGGDLNAAEVALRFFTAIRQLKVSSLLVAHTAKESIPGKRRSVYGSAFFTNYARAIWEMKRVSETGEDEVIVGMFHRKHNNSRGFHEIGLRFNFNEHATTVQSQNVRDVPELVKEASNTIRVREILKQGAMTVADIATELDISQSLTRTALSRMKRKQQAVKTEGNKWGLTIAQESI